MQNAKAPSQGDGGRVGKLGEHIERSGAERVADSEMCDKQVRAKVRVHAVRTKGLHRLARRETLLYCGTFQNWQLF